MLRYRLRPPSGAIVLACGSFLLFQAADGVARSALAQVGLSGRTAPAPADGSARAAARRAAGPDQQPARDLDEARGVLAFGNVREGRRRLEVLVARYPDAAASDQARRELARLYSLPADAARSASRLWQGPSVIKATVDDGGTQVPVSLGVPASTGRVIAAQNAWVDEPRLAHAAEQDFRLYVGDRVFFGDRSAELGARALALLAAQARWLMRVPEAAVVVEGHADDQGSADFNQELAARRAQAVRDRLVAEGVEPGRIALDVHGRQQPVALCVDGECAAHNRRAVTVLRTARAAGNAAPRAP